VGKGENRRSPVKGDIKEGPDRSLSGKTPERGLKK
jgi:hypothetical protein